MQKHVFISYIRENQDEVNLLCDELEAAGISIWLDREQIKPGHRWKDVIREAIENGSFFIACFSKEYEKKDKSYMNEELALAIEQIRKYQRNRIWFIPVLLSNCYIPNYSIGGGETLRDIQWVDLGKEKKKGIKKIIEVISLQGVIEESVITNYNFEITRLDFQGTRKSGIKLKSRKIINWMLENDVSFGRGEHYDDSSFDIKGVKLGKKWKTISIFKKELRNFIKIEINDSISKIELLGP